MYRTLLIFCFLLTSPALADAKVDPITILLKGNNLQESDCPELVNLLENQSVSEQERHEEAPITVALSYHILVLGCPMRFMTTPINALHRSEISETREDVSVSLGAAYEYAVRVTRDLDEARYWYRKLAYRLVGAPEFYLKFTRQRIAQINPDYRTMSAENWSAALDKGELASGIFEEELLAVQELMNGPVSGIVRASEHLYHGTGGFPRDKEIAKKIIYDTARDGVPEAQYAFAIALLDRRFSILGQERQFQLMQAETYLMKAVSQRYLPSILRLAEICQSNEEFYSDLAALALYRMAEHEGASDVDAHLERLRARMPPSFESELKKIEVWIGEGKSPVC
jgi:TPR repeat protein